MPSSWLVALTLLPLLLIVVIVLSGWFDITERRIPNWITGGGLLGALILRGVLGPDVVWTGFLGAALGLALGIPLFAAGAMGAGDGKLLATVGSMLGMETFLWCLPLIGVFGGLLTVLVTFRNGTLLPTLARARDFLLHLVTFGHVGDLRDLSAPDAASVPYGIAIGAGAYAAWLGWGLAL